MLYPKQVCLQNLSEESPHQTKNLVLFRGTGQYLVRSGQWTVGIMLFDTFGQATKIPPKPPSPHMGKDVVLARIPSMVDGQSLVGNNLVFIIRHVAE